LWFGVLSNELELSFIIRLSLKLETTKQLSLDELCNTDALFAAFPKEQVAKAKAILRNNHPMEVDYLDRVKNYSNAYSEIRDALKKGEIPKEVGKCSYGDLTTAWIMWKNDELGETPFG
jgi:hypothetical protein